MPFAFPVVSRIYSTDGTFQNYRALLPDSASFLDLYMLLLSSCDSGKIVFATTFDKARFVFSSFRFR